MYFFCAIGILGRIPQLINPIEGMKRFMADDKKLPSDKGELTILEFAFGFTAVNFACIWGFVLYLTFVMADLTALTIFLLVISIIFIGLMAKTIVDIGELGFAIKPMLFFLILISTMFGASLLQLLA